MKLAHLTFCSLLSLIILTTGCGAWLLEGGSPLPAQLRKYNEIQSASQVPKAILDDVQNYMLSEKISPNGTSLFYYENTAHEYAAEISQDSGTEIQAYYLFYDKNNIRTKVKKDSVPNRSWM
jgi:hypothetical protein